ncbi:MAG: AI-2E family transporter [Candidatus Andersenbacteria bacterium]
MDRNNLQIVFFLILLTAVLLLAGYLFWPFLSAVVLGGTLSVLFRPLYRHVRNVLPNESLASLVTSAGVVVVIFAPFFLFGFLLVREAAELYTSLGGATSVTNTLQNVRELPYGEAISEWVRTIDIQNLIRRLSEAVVNNVGPAFSSAVGAVVTILLSVLVMYYLFKDGPALRKKLVELSPLVNTHDDKIFARLHLAVLSVVRGSLLIAVLQGFATGVGFTLFGVPNPVLWGGVAAVAALIPSFGTAIVSVPAILYLFAIGAVPQSIGLAIWAMVAVGLIDNLLGPKFIQRGMHIHPLVILLSVLGGLTLFGPIGFLLGPLTIALLFALLDVYQVLIPDKGK